jgi:hypothetical protein
MTVPDFSQPQRLRVLEVGHQQLVDQLAEMVVSMREMRDCMSKGEGRMSAIEVELKTNSATTTEVRDILSTARGAFRLFGWIGMAVKWLGGIAGAIGALYVAAYSITHGKPPSP